MTVHSLQSCPRRVMSHISASALQSVTDATAAVDPTRKAPFRARLIGSLIRAASRETAQQELGAVLLAAAMLLSLPFAARAENPSSAHTGLCRVAIVNGQHVQPSSKCHLPPPLTQNPASIKKTTPAQREELERLGISILRLGTTSAEPKPEALTAARPLRPAPRTRAQDR
jgi:hypothetical protein